MNERWRESKIGWKLDNTDFVRVTERRSYSIKSRTNICSNKRLTTPTFETSVGSVERENIKGKRFSSISRRKHKRSTKGKGNEVPISS